MAVNSLQQSLQIKSTQPEKALLLACLQGMNNKTREAIILLNDSFKHDQSSVLYNGLLSIFYDISKDKGLHNKFLSLAQRKMYKDAN